MGIIGTPFATLRVLTLNAWGLPFAKRKSQRMRNIGAELARGNYDIIGLQEIWDTKDLTPILAGACASGIQYHHYFSSGLVGSGLAILSRYPIREVDFRRFRLIGSAETCYHGDYFAGKGIGFARVQTPFAEVDVYVAHTIAQYHEDDADGYKAHRAAQHYEMARYITTQSPTNPVIVLGDLNTRPDQFGHRLFKSLTGLTDCYESLHPYHEGITYIAQNPLLGDAIPPSRLDYVFARNGAEVALSPVAAEITFQPPAGSSTNESTAPYSDHFGVAARLKIGDSGGAVIISPREKRAALTELLAVLRAGLKEAQARRRAHTRKLGLGAGSTLPVGLAGQLVSKWLACVVMPLVILYTLIHILFAYLTVPQEIGDLEAFVGEVDLQVKTLAINQVPEWK